MINKYVYATGVPVAFFLYLLKWKIPFYMHHSDLFRKLSVAWMEAWKGRDQDKLEKLAADEMVLFSAFFKNGFVTRQTAIQSMLNSFPISDYHYRFVNFLIYEEFAIVNSFLYLMMASGLAAEKDAYQVTDVWKKKNGEWQLICRQPTLSTLVRSE